MLQFEQECWKKKIVTIRSSNSMSNVELMFMYFKFMPGNLVYRYATT
jgi:hypothetical protein